MVWNSTSCVHVSLQTDDSFQETLQTPGNVDWPPRSLMALYCTCTRNGCNTPLVLLSLPISLSRITKLRRTASVRLWQDA